MTGSISLLVFDPFVAIVKPEIHGDESSQIYHLSTVPLYCVHILSNAPRHIELRENSRCTCVTQQSP